MIRNLRIAFSLTCLIAGVLLIALWVRSYREDWIQSGDGWHHLGPNRLYAVYSGQGKLILTETDRIPNLRGWTTVLVTEGRDATFAGFGYRCEPFSRCINVPYWFLVLTTPLIAVTPWLEWPRRFSLRTLLIATTVTAAMLALIAAALR